MDPVDWKLVLEAFEAVRELPEGQREARARELLSGRPELVGEVLALLGQRPPTEFVEPLGEPLSLEQVFGGGLAGTRVDGFELLEELGRGGMGVVYLAEQVALSRKVAVKVLPLARAAEEEARERFRREARAASRLDHPGLVRVLAFGEREQLAWYAMEWVDGRDLAAEVGHQREAASQRAHEPLLIPRFEDASYVEAVVRGVIQVAEALQHAHDQGVVHRDVKPQNVLVDRKGTFRLTDFGLAKDERFGSLTATGAMRGTPYYMSPEQVRMLRGAIDHRTDIYSLSVVLYEVLALRRPYEGRTSQEVLDRIVRSRAVPLREANPRVPRDLEVVCEKGMSKDPDARYASARDLAGDLRRFLRHEAILARAPGPGERLHRWLAEHRTAVIAFLLIAVASGIGAVVTQRLADRREIAELERLAEELDAEPDWSDVTDQLVELRNRIDRAPPNESAALESFALRLAEFRDEEGEAARAQLVRGLGGRTDDPDWAPYRVPHSTERILDALMRFERLRQVAPRDAMIAGWARAPIGTRLEVSVQFVQDGVAIDLADGSARVELTRLDPYRELEVVRLDLGAAPTARTVVEGPYRIRAVVPGVGHAEAFEWVFPDAAAYPVTLRIHPDAEAREGMVRIPGGELELRPRLPIRPDPNAPDDAYRHNGCLFLEGEEHVEPFFLDLACVTNADVLAYLDSSGADPPVHWISLGFDGTPESLASPVTVDRWLELPAVAITHEEANAYARFYGRRLPRHLELEVAVRGAQDGTWALGDPGADPAGPFANVNGPSLATQRLSLEAIYPGALEALEPADDPRFAQGPFGLRHAYGNVSVWSSSWFVWRFGDHLHPDPNSFLVFGSAYGMAVDGHAPDTHAPVGAGPDFARTTTGFRCAHSILVPN